MNIIEIASWLELEKKNLNTLSESDFLAMESKLSVEKESNANLNEQTIKSFFKAIKNYPNTFYDVMNNRVWFNFLAKKNYSRKQFTDSIQLSSKREIRFFVQTFLMNEINPYVLKKIDVNDYEEINSLTEEKDFFPEDILNEIIIKVTQKLDLASATLKHSAGDLSKIQYVKDYNFFLFLNGLKDPIIEEKVKTVFTAAKNLYKMFKGSELAKNIFTAMDNYKPLDSSFSDSITKYKGYSEENYKPFQINKNRKYIPLAIVGLLVLIRVGFLIRDISKIDFVLDSSEEDMYEYEAEPPKIDRYYTNMKHRIDSFRVFLVKYNPAEIRRLTQINNFKSGQNPFETFYESQPAEESSTFIKVRNSSGYDMILLENIMAYDTIKMPVTSHFIKAGETVEINFTSSERETVFNAYIGKKLATFQTESNHLFIRRGSIVEYRFSELIPNAEELIKKDLYLKNDTTLKVKNGDIVLE